MPIRTIRGSAPAIAEHSNVAGAVVVHVMIDVYYRHVPLKPHFSSHFFFNLETSLL